MASMVVVFLAAATAANAQPPGEPPLLRVFLTDGTSLTSFGEWVRMDDKVVKRMVAIINSMTKKERRFPDLLNGSRRARIAKGAGVQPSEVNALVKQFENMQKMMKKLGGAGLRGMMKKFQRMPMGGGGGMPFR